MFKLEIGWMGLLGVGLAVGGYYGWKEYRAAKAPPAAAATKPPATTTTTTTTTVVIDPIVARASWDRGVLDGAAYAYNATVRGGPFDNDHPALIQPGDVTNFTAYAAGHRCGRTQGVRLGQGSIALFGAGPAAALTFDPADTAGGGVAKTGCAAGFAAWLAAQVGSTTGTVTTSGRTPAAGGGPVLWGRRLWGGPAQARRLYAARM